MKFAAIKGKPKIPKNRIIKAIKFITSSDIPSTHWSSIPESVVCFDSMKMPKIEPYQFDYSHLARTH